MSDNHKTDVSQISKMQSWKDTQRQTIQSKPPIHGTPLPPKTTPRNGK